MALTDNLVAYYRGGDFTDEQGSHNSTSQQNVSIGTGKYGDGWILDTSIVGADHSRVNLDTTIDFDVGHVQATGYTISAWMKDFVYGNVQGVIASPLNGAMPLGIKYGVDGDPSDGITGPGIYLGYETGGFNFALDVGTNQPYFSLHATAGPTSFNAGEWYHFAVTVLNDTAKYYINGVHVATATYAWLNRAVAFSRIGGSFDSWYVGDRRSVAGAMDEVAVWNRVLSDSEIVTVYSAEIMSPEISSNTNTLDFGTIFVNETKTETVTITNIGEVPLQITNIQKMGSKLFNRTGDLWVSDTLDQNQSRDIDILYTPFSNTGVHTGHITIFSNDTDEPQFQIDFSAEAIPLPPPEIDVDTNVLDFGSVKDGESKIMTVVITNTGQGDLNITDVQLTSQHSFSKLTPGTEFVLAENATQSINVEFAPQGNINFNAYLTILSDDEDESNIQIDLLGEWIKPPPAFITKKFKNNAPLVTSKHEMQNFAKASNQRKRRVEQVPFIVGTRTNVARRRGSDSDFE
jgi:hypothetical protein